MESLKILFLCMIAAVVYGIVHDQVTARVCVEYFTIGHPPIFGTESPTLLAFGWGVLATFWCGLIVGLLAVFVCRLGSWPKRNTVQLLRPIVLLLIIMAFASLLAGSVGYGLAKVGLVRLFGRLAVAVPTSRHAVFLADLWAHGTAYAVGLIGGIALCVWILVRRCQEAAALWRNGMVASLREAFEKASALPQEQQDALAAIMFEKIDAECRAQHRSA